MYINHIFLIKMSENKKKRPLWLALTLTLILGEGVNYPTLRVLFYANECNEGRDANPNECHSTLMSAIREIYYIYNSEFRPFWEV